MQMNDIERMIENNEDDALSEYLEAWARGASRLDWHNRELARLEEEKAATTYLLQEMTAKYLRVRGRFNLHGLLGDNRVGALGRQGVDVSGGANVHDALSPNLVANTCSRA